MLKLLITGAQGQIGRALSERATHYPNIQCIPCSRADLDISSLAAINAACLIHHPDIIINTAAYTAVDLAETEQEQASKINFQGASNLALVCKQKNIALVHLSTDYVFNGSSTLPYQETDQTRPINIYGLTKLLGEEAIRSQLDNYIILRLSAVFSPHGKNFYTTMQRLAHTQQQISVVTDQITCPTSAYDIAEAIYLMLGKKWQSGLYHFCSHTPVSWYDFASKIVNRKLLAISSAEYAAAAKRPAYAVLDCSKINEHYGIKQPDWTQALKQFVSTQQENLL